MIFLWRENFLETGIPSTTPMALFHLFKNQLETFSSEISKFGKILST
jgi:hypothetical protein